MSVSKCSRNKNFSLTHHKRNWRNDHWLAVRASEDETSDAFSKCIFSVSACIYKNRTQQDNFTCRNKKSTFFKDYFQDQIEEQRKSSIFSSLGIKMCGHVM